MRKYCFWPLFLLFCSAELMAQNLSLHWVHELPKDIQQNITSYLGDLPTSTKSREIFIYTAKSKIESALNSQGYYKATTNTTVTKHVDKTPWQLAIAIQLNQKTILRNIDIQVLGAANVDPDFSSLLNLKALKSGDGLHHGKYEAIKTDLLALGLNKGYFDQQLIKSTIALHQSFDYADITIIYDSGIRYKFGDVTFSDINIKKSLMAKFIPFKKEEFYSLDKVQKLQKYLEKTGYFNSVLVMPKIDKAQDGYLPLDVLLTHTKSHKVKVGAGFSTDKKFNASLDWRTPLLNQSGHLLETRLVYSNINPSALVNYHIPLSHPVNDILELKLLVNKDEFGDLESQLEVFQVSRLFNDENGWLKQSYLKLLQEDWFSGEYDDDGQYVIPGFSWFKTKKSGSILDPSNGFSQYYNAEFAYSGAGSETSFVRLNARFKYIKTLLPNHRLIVSTELGLIKIDKDNYADVSPSLLFFAGGDQSIRGFGYQTVGPTITVDPDGTSPEELVIGGTHLITASLEYQYYLSEKFRVGLFTDHGSVTRGFSLDHVYSVGSGLHYISPVGAIKVDVARSISEVSPEWRFHFNIGAEL